MMLTATVQYKKRLLHHCCEKHCRICACFVYNEFVSFVVTTSPHLENGMFEKVKSMVNVYHGR
jgi:hypothetical protein